MILNTRIETLYNPCSRTSKLELMKEFQAEKLNSQQIILGHCEKLFLSPV